VSPPTPGPGIERDILRMILYFDVFKHPLSMAELTRLVRPGDPEAVLEASERLVARQRLSSQGIWRFRPGQQHTLERRLARARRAERLWPRVKAAAHVLSRFPYVRALLVTGAMSKNSAGEEGDIDWLILVEPGRVWTLKSLLQVFRRALPEVARQQFCTNYLLDTAHLRLDDRNLFTAIELATAIPISGPEAAVALLDQNAWAARFVPGLSWSRERASHAETLRRAEGLERALNGRWSEGLEHRAREGWRRYWDRKYDWLPEGVRAQRFKRREEIATNHLHDFQEYVLREVQSRLVEEGLDEQLWDGPVARSA